MRDVIRIEFLAAIERPRRATSNLFDERSEMLPDDDLSELFMRKAEAVQLVVVEEMAERAMSDVVDERGDAQEFFDEGGRGKVGHGVAQKGIQVSRESSGHMHGAQRMHEPRMLRRWIHPAGALELINVTQPLNPGRINQVFFSSF